MPFLFPLFHCPCYVNAFFLITLSQLSDKFLSIPTHSSMLDCAGSVSLTDPSRKWNSKQLPNPRQACSSRHQIVIVGPTGCRPYYGFLLLLLLLLLLQPLSRSSLKHLYFHGSSIIFNILYILGKRTAPGFIWWWLRQWQRHTQRQIRRQRQELSKASLPVYISSFVLCCNKYI